MKILSVDFGDARTGLAICDKSEFLASPVCVVQERHFERCADAVAAKAKELLDLIKQVANGELTKNEIQGNREIAIFKDGVTL
jgi:RNase H-fold protein (predicted Holliday junction resolvase)